MYSAQRSCDTVSNAMIEPFPMRALSDRDQTLLDAVVTINDLSLDKDLGYFVSKCIHGNTHANDIHGLHYQTNA